MTVNVLTVLQLLNLMGCQIVVTVVENHSLKMENGAAGYKNAALISRVSSGIRMQVRVVHVHFLI